MKWIRYSKYTGDDLGIEQVNGRWYVASALTTAAGHQDIERGWPFLRMRGLLTSAICCMAGATDRYLVVL